VPSPIIKFPLEHLAKARRRYGDGNPALAPYLNRLAEAYLDVQINHFIDAEKLLDETIGILTRYRENCTDLPDAYNLNA